MIAKNFLRKILRIAMFSLMSVVLLLTCIYGVLVIYVWWNDYHDHFEKPLHEAIHKRIKKDHEVAIIDDGLSSLAMRLELIEQAQESIEMEFFIYEIDLASQIITQKLIEKAQQGVKVRILVDFAQPVFKLAPIYSLFLKKYNIETKYYNTSSMVSFIKSQHRSHRKLCNPLTWK